MALLTSRVKPLCRLECDAMPIEEEIRPDCFKLKTGSKRGPAILYPATFAARLPVPCCRTAQMTRSGRFMDDVNSVQIRSGSLASHDLFQHLQCHN